MSFFLNLFIYFISLLIYIFSNRSLGTFFHGFRILFPYSVSVSVSVFRIPDSGFPVLVLPIFLQVVRSLVNHVNNLYSLTYKVQQNFFVPANKTGISEQHDTSFLLTKYYSY